MYFRFDSPQCQWRSLGIQGKSSSLSTYISTNELVCKRQDKLSHKLHSFFHLKKKKLVKLSSMMIQCINAKLSEQKMLELCLLKNKIAITKTGPFRFYNVFIVITLLSLTPCALHQIPC